MAVYNFSTPASYYLDPRGLATAESDRYDDLESELEEIDSRLDYLQGTDLDEYADNYDELYEALCREEEALEEEREEIRRKMEYLEDNY